MLTTSTPLWSIWVGVLTLQQNTFSSSRQGQFCYNDFCLQIILYYLMLSHLMLELVLGNRTPSLMQYAETLQKCDSFLPKSGSTTVIVDHDNNNDNDNETHALFGDVSTGNGLLQVWRGPRQGGRCLFKRILATAGFSPAKAGVFSPSCRRSLKMTSRRKQNTTSISTWERLKKNGYTKFVRTISHLQVKTSRNSE